jgi:hypothetical protein
MLALPTTTLPMLRSWSNLNTSLVRGLSARPRTGQDSDRSP